MALETATYLDSLVTSNPTGSDQASTADDHIRLLKACLQRTFPNIAGEVSISAGLINRAGTGSVTAALAIHASTAAALTTVTKQNVTAENSRSNNATLADDSAITGISLNPGIYELRGQVNWYGGNVKFLITPDAAPTWSTVHYVGADVNTGVASFAIKTISQTFSTVTTLNYGEGTVVLNGGLDLAATTTFALQWAQATAGPTPVVLNKATFLRFEKLD